MNKKIEMVHIARALDKVRGLPVLTSNQCFDLASELNTMLVKPAEQHKGEPIGSLMRDKHQNIVIVPIGDPHIKDGMQVYTHADAGEVERLRETVDMQMNMIKSLRAELVKFYSNDATISASAAQSAPVANCTNEDAWNCKYCRNTENCAALKDSRNFGKPSSMRCGPGNPCAFPQSCGCQGNK